MKKVFYVNHKSQKCGVYEFGLAIGKVLEKSTRYNVKYVECDSLSEFLKLYEESRPEIVIYNYLPETLKWVVEINLFRFYKLYGVKAIHIGTIHEVYQQVADSLSNELFDFHIAADPTLLLKNPIVFKTGRLVPKFHASDDLRSLEPTKVPSFGSFGFATGGKGFGRIIDTVQAEFDEAIININISYSKYMDSDGRNAHKEAENLHKRVIKPGIKLKVTHHHFTTSELQSFLQRNSLNLFLYDYQEHRGISSTIDWALSVNRPIGITKSSMFRHLFSCYPSICVEDSSLKQILLNGTAPIEKLAYEWSDQNLIWDYERMLTKVSGYRPRNRYISKLKNFIKRKVLKRNIQTHLESLWLKPGDHGVFTGFVEDTYKPINDEKLTFNRLLDNEARELYKHSIEFITKCCPELISKKIPEANVQQAFVFDTAYRIAKKSIDEITLLAVGAFEDTAFVSLQKLGFRIDGIDPVINYDVGEFLDRPDRFNSTYDIIISTSVIEHVENDEKFIEDISKLLKVGGTAILTCDFNDFYKKGDEIPYVDYRFYTQRDLRIRLMEKIPNCKLIDEPKWDAPCYDFNLGGRYNYSFASFVFIKFKE